MNTLTCEAVAMAKQNLEQLIDRSEPMTVAGLDQGAAGLREALLAFEVDPDDPLQVRAAFVGSAIACESLSGAEVDVVHGVQLYGVVGMLADMVKV